MIAHDKGGILKRVSSNYLNQLAKRQTRICLSSVLLAFSTANRGDSIR
jgi:hypothetical protein